MRELCDRDHRQLAGSVAIRGEYELEVSLWKDSMALGLLRFFFTMCSRHRDKEVGNHG
jgi:hypothetical protein